MTLTGIHGKVALHYQGDCTPVPPVPETITCALDFTITSGSGFLEGAHGDGTMSAVVHPELSAPNPLQGPWPATWTMQGHITY